MWTATGAASPRLRMCSGQTGLFDACRPSTGHPRRQPSGRELRLQRASMASLPGSLSAAPNDDRFSGPVPPPTALASPLEALCRVSGRHNRGQQFAVQPDAAQDWDRVGAAERVPRKGPQKPCAGLVVVDHVAVAGLPRQVRLERISRPCRSRPRLRAPREPRETKGTFPTPPLPLTNSPGLAAAADRGMHTVPGLAVGTGRAADDDVGRPSCLSEGPPEGPPTPPGGSETHHDASSRATTHCRGRR